MSRVLEIVNRAIGNFLAVLMATMLVNVTWQVVSRLLLNSPSSFTEELALFLMIWIGVLGASYAYKTRAHLSLDLLTGRLSSKDQPLAAIIAQLFCLIFVVVVMIIGGTNLVQLTLSLEQTSPALGVRMGYVYSVIPISGLLMTLYALDNIKQSLQLRRHR